MCATAAPELVRNKKVICISPAAVFSGLRPSFYFYALMPIATGERFGFTYLWCSEWMSGAHIDYLSAVDDDDILLESAVRPLQLAHDVPLAPKMFDDVSLAKLTSSPLRVVLVIGQEDPILSDIDEAVLRAREFGAEAVVVPDAGHLWCRTMKETFVDVVVKTLLGVERRRSRL